MSRSLVLNRTARNRINQFLNPARRQGSFFKDCHAAVKFWLTFRLGLRPWVSLPGYESEG